MAEAFDRTAWLRSWKAEAEAQKAQLAAQRAEMARQGEEWLTAQGRPPKEVAATASPAAPAPPAPSASPAAYPPTDAELEFERVRKGAGARIRAERETRRAEETGVALILAAFRDNLPANDRRVAAMQPQR